VDEYQGELYMSQQSHMSHTLVTLLFSFFQLQFPDQHPFDRDHGDAPVQPALQHLREAGGGQVRHLLHSLAPVGHWNSSGAVLVRNQASIKKVAN
jgi:hypothetical protein